MTPAYERAVREGADAELRGDAAEAFRLHRSVPMFRQSTHGDQLQQLRDLGDAAPGWLVNRWLTVQARRRVWTGSDQQATNRALQLVVPLIYPEAIPIERIGCEHVEQVMPWIYERDWVVRQADVYDLGALRRLVDHHVSAELLERSDQIDAWCGAPMRACRVDVVADGRDTVTVTDLTSGETIEVADLGMSLELGAGDHLLGRVVPTAEPPGAMFDWRPLPVGELVADAVAADPRRWLTTFHAQTVRGEVEPGHSHRAEPSLTSELPYRGWLSLVGVPLDDCPGHDPRPLVAEAVGRALDLAAEGAAAVAPHRHAIGDLLLDPLFDDTPRWRHVAPEHLPAWELLAQVAPRLARPICVEQALWCTARPELPDAIA
jgi:hypothetical protein